MHTMHYRIYSQKASNGPPSELTKRFGAITWELVNILRENFPSKISLVQEGIEQCSPFYQELSTSELTRRMLSCILSLREEARELTLDEVEDVTWAMDYAAKLKEYRSLSACLDLLNSDRINDRDFVECVRPYKQSLIQVQHSDDPRQM